MITALRLRRTIPLALLAFGLICHFWGYLDYPLDLGADAARLAIHTWDFLDRGIWPFYIYHQDAPNPLLIYLQAPLFIVFGFTPAVLRGLAVFMAALLSPLAYIACRELFAPDSRFAIRTGLIAAVSLALAPFLQVFARHGTEVILLPVFVLFVAACLWRGFRHAQWPDFLLAGVGLGLSQYSYIVARILPLMLAIAGGLAIWADRRLLSRWRGLGLMVFTAFIVTIPQLVLFVAAPHTFFARTQQSAGQFVFALPDPVPIFLAKVFNQFLALGWQWSTGYHPFSTRPILDAVLFIGLLSAVGTSLRFRSAPALFVLSLAGCLLIPDVLAYEGLSPSANRLMGAYPLLFILGAMGCAWVWGWLERRGYSSRWTGFLMFALVIGSSLEGQWNFHSQVIPKTLAAEGLEWQTNLVEVAEADYVKSHLTDSILIPASEYERVPLTFLLINNFPQRVGATQPPLAAGEAVAVIMPAVPDRPTTDGPPAGYIADHWVLLKNGIAYFLPPTPQGITLARQTESLYASNGVLAATVTDGFWSGVSPSLRPATATFANGLEVVGYHADPLVPGQPVTVTVYWRTRQSLVNDVQIFTQILDRNGNAIAAVHDWPFHGAYRSRAWRVGEVISLSYQLDIPPDALAGVYQLATGVFDIVQNQRVLLSNGADIAAITPLKIPLPKPVHQPAQLIDVHFGESIQLIGYTLTANASNLNLGLFWSSTKPIDFDYTIFVHVVDDAEAIVAQADSQPVQGAYPTSIWSLAEVIEDQHSFAVAPGHYRVFTGLYRWDTGERLAANLNGEPVVDNRLLLGEITVP
jgi:hypothetical protein